MDQGHFPVAHTETEWRARLTPEQFAVMRDHGTERPGSCALNTEKRAGRVRLRGLRAAVIREKDQVRERHRLAEFQHADRRRARNDDRPQLGHDPHRGRTAPAAARISAMCFPTARLRPGCVTASTAWRRISPRRRNEGAARRGAPDRAVAARHPGGPRRARFGPSHGWPPPDLAAAIAGPAAHEPIRASRRPSAGPRRRDRGPDRQSRHARGDRLLVDPPLPEASSCPTGGSSRRRGRSGCRCFK